MRLGIDLDGVVANWVDGMRRHFVARGWPVDTLPDPHEYAVWSCWPMTKDTFMEGWERWAAGGGYTTLEPYPGAIDGMRYLADLGHTLHIVTARSRTRRGIGGTIDWLERHGVPFKSLAFDSDKATHRMDLWVEDSTANAIAIAQACGRPILMDQAWNQDAPSYIARAYGWPEVVGYVEAASLGAQAMWDQWRKVTP